MAEHTPPPWRTGRKVFRTIYGPPDVENPEGRLIGVMDRPEDARRVVALWNACEGIPTEELEGCADYGQRYSDPRHRLEMLSEFARDASYEQPEPPPVEFDEDDDEDEDDG